MRFFLRNILGKFLRVNTNNELVRLKSAYSTLPVTEMSKKLKTSRNKSSKMSTLSSNADLEQSVIILSNGYMNAPKSCVINIGRDAYLINCGEGSQRQIIQGAFRFGTTTNIFFTRADWSTISGLPAFGKLSEDVNTSNNLLAQRIFIHSPVVNNPTKNFLSFKYRALFLDQKCRMKEYDYEANNGAYNFNGLTIKNIDMKDKDDASMVPCYSYLFYLPETPPGLKKGALSKMVILSRTH